MKLGIIAPSHDENGIKYVSELGLKWVEFDVNGDDVSYLNADTISDSLNNYGVKMGAVGRWGRFRINADGSINTKEQNDEYKLIDFCRKVGCPVYICGVNYVNELSLYANYTAAINYIKTLMDYAGDDVKICTYNCDWFNYIYEPKSWDIVNAHLKGLGIKYDPSHSINGGRDYIKEALDYGDKVYHIHLKGTVNVNGVHVDDPPAGLDMVDWGTLLSIFQKHGYDAMLSIEPHSSVWQGEIGAKGVRYTIEHFRKMPFVTE